MPKLTESEKKQRGTLRKDRQAKPRRLEIIQREISDANQGMDDMRHNLSLAMTEIRLRGLMVKTKVLDSHGKPITTERVNPALKVYKEALAVIRSLKRYLILLQEEETQATAIKERLTAPRFVKPKPIWNTKEEKTDFNESQS
jgi:hypothetical protein